MPEIPGYVCWAHSREGARRASGGIAVLVHERLASHVQRWQPGACSPYHMWVRIDAAAGLPAPLYLAAAYLPPYSSKYGLRSAQQLEDYFTGLLEEACTALAQPGGPEVLLCGDWNAHVGTQQEHRDMLQVTSYKENALSGPAGPMCVAKLPLRSKHA